MLRVVIDWAADKLASAFSWIKEMASSFGAALWRKDIPENDDEGVQCSPFSDPESANILGSQTVQQCKKQRQPACVKCRQTDFDRHVRHDELKIDYPLIHSPYSGKNVRKGPIFSFPGHAKVTLVSFARIPSNPTELSRLDFSPEVKTYARVLKPPHCSKWQSTDDDCCKKLLAAMRFWKGRKGIFSVFIQVDESDCGAGDLSTAKLCPMTLMLVTKVREKITELFGEALALEEKLVFQDGKRAMTIYVAPSIGREENQKNNINEAKLKKEETKKEIEQPVKSCDVSGVPTKEEDHYLVLEDKLMRRHDYDRKRKLGKANRRRLRQPATSVPVTKHEFSLMETKSEPISMRHSRKRNSRRGRGDELPVEKNSEMRLGGIGFAEYDFEEKPSKRSKIIDANFRRLLRRQKVVCFGI